MKFIKNMNLRELSVLRMQYNYYKLDKLEI